MRPNVSSSPRMDSRSSAERISSRISRSANEAAMTPTGTKTSACSDPHRLPGMRTVNVSFESDTRSSLPLNLDVVQSAGTGCSLFR